LIRNCLKTTVPKGTYHPMIRLIKFRPIYNTRSVFSLHSSTALGGYTSLLPPTLCNATCSLCLFGDTGDSELPTFSDLDRNLSECQFHPCQYNVVRRVWRRSKSRPVELLWKEMGIAFVYYKTMWPRSEIWFVCAISVYCIHI